MLISVEMCGFSKGESDSRIRKPVAKKKIKMLTDQVFKWSDGEDETIYDHWMNGAEAQQLQARDGPTNWDDVLEFASYAFNKSHSAGYAILVMQTAWLKAHYPNEYMAAVLTSYTGKTDKIVHYVSACRHDGIAVLPPDINESGTEFTATSEGVRFGLAGIRGVGEGVTEAIIAEREKGGPFKNLHDFVERVDASQANRRVIEALIKGGAFDSTGIRAASHAFCGPRQPREHHRRRREAPKGPRRGPDLAVRRVRRCRRAPVSRSSFPSPMVRSGTVT